MISIHNLFILITSILLSTQGFSSPAVFSQTNFAVVVDVGSTGSRSHVFEFEFDRDGCGGTGAAHLTLPEKSSKIRPGFSTFIDTRLRESTSHSITKREAIMEYLQLIKNEVDGMVPKERRSTTPVWLLGTAGMRHFNPDELNEILTLMRDIVATEWSDYKTHADWIDVVDGEREGLFSWVVLNQLLGRQIIPESQDILISSSSPVTKLEGHSVALVELGGASAQVVLQPPSNVVSQLPDPASITRHHNGSVHLLEGYPGFVVLDFCNKSSIVYARSFQGFGRQLALQRYLALHEGPSALPCLPSDMVFPAVELSSMVAIEEIGALYDGKSEGLRGSAEGTFEMCKKAVDGSIFGEKGNLTAQWNPLPFEIDSNIDIIGTENFYHFHKMVATPDRNRPKMFSIDTLHRRAQELCLLKEVHDVASHLNPKAEFEKATTACFGLTFLAGFLEKILRLPHDRQIEAVTRVGNVDVAWPAGHILLELPHLIHQYPDLAPESLKRNSSRHNDEL